MLRYTINHLMSISNLWHVALEFRLKNENMELNTLIIYMMNPKTCLMEVMRFYPPILRR